MRMKLSHGDVEDLYSPGLLLVMKHLYCGISTFTHKWVESDSSTRLENSEGFLMTDWKNILFTGKYKCWHNFLNFFHLLGKRRPVKVVLVPLGLFPLPRPIKLISLMKTGVSHAIINTTFVTFMSAAAASHYCGASAT